jgi:hypothetical protein
LTRAFIRQLDIAHEILAHGLRDGVPAGPGIEKLLGIAAFGDNLAQVVEVLAAFRPGGTVLALAIGAFHAGRDAGELLAFVWIGGRGEGQGELQQRDFARRLRVELEAGELRRFLSVVHGGIDGALIDLGGHGFRIVRDIGGFDPVGAARVHV